MAGLKCNSCKFSSVEFREFFRNFFNCLKDAFLWTGMKRWNQTDFRTETGAYYKPREIDRFDTDFQREIIMMNDGKVQNLLSNSVIGLDLAIPDVNNGYGPVWTVTDRRTARLDQNSRSFQGCVCIYFQWATKLILIAVVSIVSFIVILLVISFRKLLFNF